MMNRHDPLLVATAAVICALASFTATALLSRALVAAGRQRRLWLGVAALEFGGGVWSLHFVAMLGFMPGMAIRYDLGPTLGSVALAMAGTGLAFTLAMRPGAGVPRRAAAAAVLTLAIGGMHYLGVAAMHMGGSFRLAPLPVLASVLICFACCGSAVAGMDQLGRRRWQLVVAGSLSAAVCSLHFIGMCAIVPGGRHDAATDGLLGSGALAGMVASSSLSLMLISLALSMMDRLLHDRASAEKERLRKLTSVSFEGLLIERDGLIVDANERICGYGGYGRADILGRPVSDLLVLGGSFLGADSFPPDDTGEHCLRRADGGLMPVELLREPIVLDRCPATAIGVRDLTARHDNEAALQHLAHHDPLTGLPNRVLLGLRLRHLVDAAPPSSRHGALLCLDLDRFKPVNDTFGHAAGDRLLAEVAKRLSALLKPGTMLARIGGDEFVVLMPDAAGADPCRALADRIIAAIRSPFEFGSRSAEIGVSIGIALYPQDGETADELLRCGDIALYRAKKEGRGTYRLFEPEMDAKLQQRHALERDLRHAIDNHELDLFYQPLVDCEAGRITGYEALLRWKHPQRGFIPPSEFIPIAEETGLILPLGQWVLQTACTAAAAWERSRNVTVNLSPVQFRQPDLVECVLGVLRDTRLPPDRLELEITEGVLVEEPERATLILTQLRQCGVRVALDDFGSGYSGLGYLRQFPLDKIKIDRSFISTLRTDHRSLPIVRAMVALAHSLGMSVIAEGVETEDQLALLREHACDEVQGFLLGRPAPLERAPAAEPVLEPALTG